MSRKSFHQVQLKKEQQLVPAMLNKRRFSLKKILNRYMGLPFTQYQAVVTYDDIQEAGLESVFSAAMKEMLPFWKKMSHESEPVDIEVRGVAIALDEELSFSSYRFASLQSPVYKLPLMPDLERYEQYCHLHMQQEELFAPSVEKAIKRRAIQDFMQDLLPVVHHVPIIRLSVYDRFSDGEESATLGAILAEDSERFYLAVADAITQQLQNVDQLFDCEF
ncbi:hypothetical protein [Cesiribacter sp. SM1]|uniref:hypothetical protein n=1 Tax=Cesiribacter sp. SM1 TaxID=2861196 RepID=UPI001CD2D6B0|nr:hypothetical protein [Cesiribacter sp. SM1]